MNIFYKKCYFTVSNQDVVSEEILVHSYILQQKQWRAQETVQERSNLTKCSKCMFFSLNQDIKMSLILVCEE